MLLTQCVTQPNSYQDSVRQDGSFHQKNQITFLFSFSGMMKTKVQQEVPEVTFIFRRRSPSSGGGHLHPQQEVPEAPNI
jgi:hypothetical protein